MSCISIVFRFMDCFVSKQFFVNACLLQSKYNQSCQLRVGLHCFQGKVVPLTSVLMFKESQGTEIHAFNPIERMCRYTYVILRTCGLWFGKCVGKHLNLNPRVCRSGGQIFMQGSWNSMTKHRHS